jgi:hypothetical protein
MLRALILFSLLFAQQAADPTLPPASAKAVYTVEGRGVQIYLCSLQNSTYSWVFQSPEATLSDPRTHDNLGKHGAGPTWTWKDGSSVSGKVLQKAPSPDATSVPWLLLAATPSANPGALSQVTLVRRSDTHGGNAPANGCDSAHSGALLRVPYSATYTFYTGQ